MAPPREASALVLVHDGSWEGFLCALGDFLNEEALRGGRPGISGGRDLELRGPEGAAGLFEDRRPVPRDEARAARLLCRLTPPLEARSWEKLRAAFASDLAGREGAMARLVAQARREGVGAFDSFGDPDALLVEKAATRACREAHRLLGLLRFRELADGSLYASLDPDCAVLPLIADHFSARFPAFRWAIRDERRDEALVHEPGRGWSLGRGLRLGEEEGGSAGELPLSARELEIQAFWKRYFETIAIEERANPGLQASFMPKKYWKNLPEKDGSSD